MAEALPADAPGEGYGSSISSSVVHSSWSLDLGSDFSVCGGELRGCAAVLASCEREGGGSLYWELWLPAECSDWGWTRCSEAPGTGSARPDDDSVEFVYPCSFPLALPCDRRHYPKHYLQIILEAPPTCPPLPGPYSKRADVRSETAGTKLPLRFAPTPRESRLCQLLHEGSPLMDPFTYRSYRLPPLVLPRLIHELGLDGGTLLGLPFLTLPLLLGLCLELDRYLGGEMLLLDKLLTVTDFLPSHSPNAT